MSSLGKVAHTDQLIARELGSASRPIETIHRASTDRYQDDLSFVDADTGRTRLKITTDGHLPCGIGHDNVCERAACIHGYAIGQDALHPTVRVLGEAYGAVI